MKNNEELVCSKCGISQSIFSFVTVGEEPMCPVCCIEEMFSLYCLLADEHEALKTELAKQYTMLSEIQLENSIQNNEEIKNVYQTCKDALRAQQQDYNKEIKLLKQKLARKDKKHD